MGSRLHPPHAAGSFTRTNTRIAASSNSRTRRSRAACASTLRRRLRAARHLSEHAEVFRPVMPWPRTGHGRMASRNATTGGATAARSDCESEEVSCIAFASVVVRRASVAQLVRRSGKVFTRAQVPAFERTHNICTLKPRQPAPFLRRGHYFLYG